MKGSKIVNAIALILLVGSSFGLGILYGKTLPLYHKITTPIHVREDEARFGYAIDVAVQKEIFSRGCHQFGISGPVIATDGTPYVQLSANASSDQKPKVLVINLRKLYDQANEKWKNGMSMTDDEYIRLAIGDEPQKALATFEQYCKSS